MQFKLLLSTMATLLITFTLLSVILIEKYLELIFIEKLKIVLESKLAIFLFLLKIHFCSKTYQIDRYCY